MFLLVNIFIVYFPIKYVRHGDQDHIYPVSASPQCLAKFGTYNS